jgi:hypothetical protein
MQKVSARDQKEFQAKLIEGVYLPILRSNVGRDQQVLLRMIAELGGLDAAKSLLNNSPVQVGFRGLRKRNLLNLTVEHFVIQSPQRDLFSEGEIATAKQRLGTKSAKGQYKGHICNAADCPLRPRK